LRRTRRTLVAYLLFSTLFFVGAGVAVITCSHAQPAPQPADPVVKPVGPDELFTPLADVTYEGTAPARCLKVVVLRVPNRDSWNDSPAMDLSGSERVVAGGFELMLDQQIEYRPYFYKEQNRNRTIRYEATLRSADVPRVGSKDAVGKKFPGVDQALDTFAAEIAFLLSYAPGKKESPAQGAAFCYRRGEGVQTAVEWEFTKLGKPEADSTICSLEKKIVNLIGPHGQQSADGAWQEAPFAPVPRLVASDSALRDFVNMRDAFYGGELSAALVNYESLMAKDPACGRAALFGMEIYRAIAETQTDLAENARYNDKAIQMGREAVKSVPNDVMLRGRLAWTGAVHYRRIEFGMAGLKQAMRVQPANTELFTWWLSAYCVDDRPKQIEWLMENALPLVKDGRVEYAIATTYYGSGDYAKGVEWYAKAVALAPREHEYNKGLGLCGTYLAESSFKKQQRDVALDAWVAATDALAKCMEIDPREVKWVYEYYVRVATHDFTHLPTSEADLERLFLSQAVFTGLEPNSRTFQWDRLVNDILVVMRRTLRETCKEAKPGDEAYEMKLMARLQFARADNDTDDLIHTLWLMRGHGLRTDLYNDLMSRFGPLVNEYTPKKEDGEDGREE
jgi:tetratricopeptide (TPR) repeat protein